MSDRPPPSKEGSLIKAALKKSGLSVREAASRIGLSEGRWRQIADGYQIVSAGTYAPVKGPPDTVARMARIANVTPEQLDEAGRPDAAEELRKELTPGVRQSDEKAAIEADILDLQAQLVALTADLRPEDRQRIEQIILEEEQEMLRLRQDRLRRLREMFNVTKHKIPESGES